MATIIDLGQKVKAKYPGQYDDLSDEEVGRKVKAKYPTEYADFSDTQKTSVFKKITSGVNEEDKNLINWGIPTAFKGVQKATDIASGAVKATGIPWLVGKAVQAAGGVIGGAVGGLAETGIQAYKGITGQKTDLSKIGKSALQTAKETSQFGQFVGEEGATAAPFAGLGKIPSAVIAAPTLIEGIKEKDPTKIAIGGLGVAGAKYSKGKWIEPDIVSAGKKTISKASGKPVLPPAEKATKIAQDATAEMRTILKPNAGEIRNLEIRQGKNLDDYYRLAAEEKLPIGQTADKKLDTTEAREILSSKMSNLKNIQDEMLKTDTAKKFDLLEIGNKAKQENEVTIKNATKLKEANRDIDEFILDEVERNGRYVDGVTLNNFKSGMWTTGYNLMKPTAQSTARKLGHIAKEAIEEAYPDLTIKEINELSSNYATLYHLLESAQTKVVQGGVMQKYIAQGIGAIAGAKIPVAGPIAGQWLGGKVSEAIYSPARRSVKVGKMAEKAGIAGKQFKQTTEKAVKSLVERKPQYPLLPPSRGSALNEAIALPPRTARLDTQNTFIGAIKAPKQSVRGSSGRFETGYLSTTERQTPEQVIKSQKAAGIYKPPVKPSADPLIQEAKKYKSAEEFVNATVEVPIKKVEPVFGKPDLTSDISYTKEPIKIQIGDDGKWRVVDGNHRYWEAVEKGDKNIKVKFDDVSETKSQLTDIWNKAHKKTTQ